MSQGKPKQDGMLTWALIGCICMGVLCAMMWLVGSHMIVYYMTPVMDAVAFPWRLLPQSITGSIVPDLDFNYQLFRRHPAHISMGDWVGYVNVAMKPWSVLFIGIALLLFRRQIKKIKSGRVNQKMTPGMLAKQMMTVFTDIAPVVAIQEKLVANKLPKWARQVFPEEFVKRARYQRQAVLVPDPENGGQRVDRDRLNGFLRATGKYKHGELVLLRSPFLGRQILSIKDDIGKQVVFMDRLSDTGKAVFAILAPYAFSAGKGKVESKEVSDALNLSAYGSENGMANISIPEVAATFEAYRNHPLAKKMAKIHHWEYTFLFALLEHAQRSGKIGTWSFIWLKPTDRIMFYALNTVGRKTPHSESAFAFSQFQYERKVARKGRLPIHAHDKSPVLFTDRVADALVEEWEFYRNGDEDTDDWWQDDKLGTWENNNGLMSALGEVSQSQDLPPSSAHN